MHDGEDREAVEALPAVNQPRYQTLLPVPDELRGPQVVVRPYRADDAPQFFAAVDESRAHLQPWLPWVTHYDSVDDARNFCTHQAANWLLRTDLTAGIFDLRGGYLGGIRLEPLNWQSRVFALGYWIRKSAEGHGFITEACRLVLRLAFTDLGARRVELTCDPRNERSQRMADRLGFVLEGRLRNKTLDPTGLPRDSLMYALLPEEYRQVSRSW